MIFHILALYLLNRKLQTESRDAHGSPSALRGF